MRIIFSALIVGMACGATGAAAQDQVSYQAIKNGNYAQAEQALVAQRRAFPRHPELMLNLAAIYMKSARTEQARALYEQVVAVPDVLMDLPGNKTASSHDLARTGLSRLPTTQVSIR